MKLKLPARLYPPNIPIYTHVCLVGRVWWVASASFISGNVIHLVNMPHASIVEYRVLNRAANTNRGKPCTSHALHI